METVWGLSQKQTTFRNAGGSPTHTHTTRALEWGAPASDPGCQWSPGALISPVTRQHELTPPTGLGPEGPDLNTAHTDSATSFSTEPVKSAQDSPSPAPPPPSRTQPLPWVLRGCRHCPQPTAAPPDPPGLPPRPRIPAVDSSAHRCPSSPPSPSTALASLRCGPQPSRALLA